MKEKNYFGYIIGGVFIIFITMLLIGSIYTISAGYRGVLLTFGKPTMESKEEGLHFKVPIVQSIKKLEVRKQKIEVSAASASRDLQVVSTTVALNFHIFPSNVPLLYQELGLEYNSRIIQPAIQESVKAVTAKYAAEELITNRQAVREDMKLAMEDKLEKYFLVVDDFNIVNFDFSEEFNKAIEQKVTAEQLKLKAEKDLERIEVEARQKQQEALGEQMANIARAEGEAQAIEKINSQLLQSPQYIEWLKVTKWNGILPSVTSGMPFIDVTSKISDSE